MAISVSFEEDFLIDGRRMEETESVEDQENGSCVHSKVSGRGSRFTKNQFHVVSP